MIEDYCNKFMEFVKKLDKSIVGDYCNINCENCLNKRDAELLGGIITTAFNDSADSRAESVV